MTAKTPLGKSSPSSATTLTPNISAFTGLPEIIYFFPESSDLNLPPLALWEKFEVFNLLKSCLDIDTLILRQQ